MAIISLSLLAAFISLNMTRFVRSVVILQTGIILCVIATLLALALRNRMFDRVTFSLDIIALYALLTASYSFADKPTQATTAEHHIIETVAVIFYRSAQRHLHRLSLCISRQPR